MKKRITATAAADPPREFAEQAVVHQIRRSERGLLGPARGNDEDLIEYLPGPDQAQGDHEEDDWDASGGP